MKQELSKQIEVRRQIASSMGLEQLVNICLPRQGAIEIQHDEPHKEHPWHKHDTDETIVLIEGDMHFVWDEGETTCIAGDIINLPLGTLHGSTAGASGATYMISFRTVEI